MHLHQFPQLVYAKDGIPLDRPVLDRHPQRRSRVSGTPWLFNGPTTIGTWVWHCHILTHVEREEGMFGMVTAVVVTEPT